MALRSTDPNAFVEQLAQLLGHLGEGYGGMRAVSGPHTQPDIWMLGSTDGGARIAAALGLPFAFAHHFHPHYTEPALTLYRQLFQPSARLESPRVIVAAGVIVGEDDDHAARLALPAGVSMLRLRQGTPQPIPTVETAERIVAGLGASERAVVEEVVDGIVTGGPARVESELRALAERTGGDEVMLTSNVVDPTIRIRGLEALATAFGLEGAEVAATPTVAGAH